MYKPTPEELDIITRVNVNMPQFREIIMKLREGARDDMEQGGADVSRGQSLAYSHILKLLTLRG